MNKAIIDRAVKLLEEAMENGGGEITFAKISQVQGILETISAMLEAGTPVAQSAGLAKGPAIKLPATNEPPIPSKNNPAFVTETGDYNPFPKNNPNGSKE